MKKLSASIVLVSLYAGLASPVMAEDAPPPPSNTPARVPAAKGPSLALAIEAAKVAVEACAADGAQTVAASVVDSAGILKALLAADGTSPRGVSSSTIKAQTALQYKKSTSALFEQAKTDKAFADAVAANPNINGRPGGILIKVGDEIIGAIGVGGGRTDEPCAIAGLQKIQARLAQ
jgi:uncharacterized protein GlcG (DUF336 family)